MPERPVILFPSPEKADRNAKTRVFRRINSPQFSKQYNRLQPSFQVLQEAFRQKNLVFQQSATGINPDFALVFETVGSVENFYTAVKHCEGLEWLFDIDSDEIAPDEDFFEINKDGIRVENTLGGKVYCVMSNQQALEQILSLWRRHLNGEEDVFQRGFAGLRDIFTHIKTIRKWDASDRFAETKIIDNWREQLELDGNVPAPFEIELFYRNESEKRTTASKTVKKEINDLGGTVVQECILPEISYHGLLATLPRNIIEELVNNYDSIQLSHVDDIMFFRPGTQSVETSLTDAEAYKNPAEQELPRGNPIAAILDGMPMQNHSLLKGRVIIDDPDDYGQNYMAKYRLHGTEMASLVIYGDLNKNEEPIKHPVYIRPILKPKEVGANIVQECIPDNALFVDVLNRIIKRIKEGEKGLAAVSPDVQVVNLSMGDFARQLGNTMSPVARLIDYLSFKYKLLFIISAGNHPEIIHCVETTFRDLKARSLAQRNQLFGSVIKDNQRNLRLLSPAESINCLTVGATYDDYSDVSENDRNIWMLDKGMPAPYSAVGKGYHGIITPDLLYNGGRKFIREGFVDSLAWVISNKAPGCRAAAPYNDGTDDGQLHSFGTSDSAAQVTHEAIICYDILQQIFVDETGYGIPSGYEAILLKGMLAHGASWESFSEEISRVTGDGKKQLSKWAGNGVPDFEKTKECTRERITLIGYGKLKKDKGDVYKLPLHVDFSSRLIKRKLTVTLAYFSPISSEKQAYRSAQLWFEVDDGDKKLIPDGARQNSEWQAVRKGTLQHEIFVGEQPVVWVDEDLIIKVNCREDAGKLNSIEIPYCIFVSFEVAEGLGIDLYTTVRAQIQQRISVSNPL